MESDISQLEKKLTVAKEKFLRAEDFYEKNAGKYALAIKKEYLKKFTDPIRETEPHLLKLFHEVDEGIDMFGVNRMSMVFEVSVMLTKLQLAAFSMFNNTMQEFTENMSFDITSNDPLDILKQSVDALGKTQEGLQAGSDQLNEEGSKLLSECIDIVYASANVLYLYTDSLGRFRENHLNLSTEEVIIRIKRELSSLTKNEVIQRTSPKIIHAMEELLDIVIDEVYLGKALRATRSITKIFGKRSVDASKADIEKVGILLRALDNVHVAIGEFERMLHSTNQRLDYFNNLPETKRV